MNTQASTPKVSRRSFLGATGTAAGLGGLATFSPVAQAQSSGNGHKVRNKATILFQGDSITDAGRSRETADEPNRQSTLGGGYAWMAASSMLVNHPDLDLTIFNRGISGNKVFQLAERWEQDCLDLQPDILSILIGVNDIWHTLNGNYDGTVKIYENDYNALLERTRKELPQIKLIVCEPFVLRCGSVTEKWFPEFDHYREAARRVAKNHKAVLVPFQEMFDEAVQYAPPEHWAADGVHPTSAGASLMASTWLKAVRF